MTTTRMVETPISSAWCTRCGRRYDTPPASLCDEIVMYRGLEEVCDGTIIQFFARTPEQDGGVW